jgi:signal transduction histidine kinase
MDPYAEISLAHSRSVLESVKIHEIKIAAFTVQAKFSEAVGEAVEVLHLLGIDFPADPKPSDVIEGLQATMSDLAATGREIEALADLPEATDPSTRAALRILANVASVTYIGRPALFPLVVFQQVRLSATRGNTNASAFGYASYGILLFAMVGDTGAGYRFGQMALRVSSRFKAKEYDARTRFVTCSHTRAWTEHQRETFCAFPSVYQAALESGDLEFAGWALLIRSSQGFHLGRDLRERIPETIRYIKVVEQLKQTAVINPLRALLQVMRNLMGESTDPTRLVGEEFDGPAMLALHHAAGNAFAICHIHLNQAMLCYLFDDPAGAVKNAEALAPFGAAVVALYHSAVFYLYESLARLALDPELSPKEREASRARVHAQKDQLAVWGRSAPSNYRHKALLVEGEIARVEGRVKEARALLRQSIELARENEYQQEEALGNEGLLLLDTDGALAIEIEGTASGETRLCNSAPVLGDRALSAGIVNYVVRRRESVVLRDATSEGLFTNDPYVVEKRPKSVLCTPLVNQGRLVALLYLENNLTTGAFTQDRLEVLRLLSSQAALSLHNARLYTTLEQKVDERTRQLSEALDDLKRTQRRLVAQEKLAHLGLIISGIAHELKNPLNFVINFANLIEHLVVDLRAELDLLQPRLSSNVEPFSDILEDLAQNASRIGQHGQRADAIVRAMLEHAGKAGGRHEPTNLSAITYQSVRAAADAFRVAHLGFSAKVETALDDTIPPIIAAPHAIGRVVQNLVQNALYAVWEKSCTSPAFVPEVRVVTRDAGDRVEIRVRDNGGGIAPEIQEKIFLPFFTTKPSGDGTGLGLSLSHDIVTGHNGTLEFTTEVGAGSEFVVMLPKIAAPAEPG